MKTIVIIGPTASGKSNLALRLAQECEGEIINFDSMQVYKNLDKITACPSQKEKASLPHHLYQFRNISEPLNAIAWAQQATDQINDCIKRKKQPILVGGTGFYLKTLKDGLSPIPDISPVIVQQLADDAHQKGINFLYEKLQKADPELAGKLQPNDNQRIIRALSVFMATKQSLSQWQRLKPVPYFTHMQWHIISLLPERSLLYEACNQRFDSIIKEGALDEVAHLYQQKLSPNLPAMRSVGVKQLLAYFNGEWDLAMATEKAKTATRNYAKRQCTWLRNQLTDALIFEQFGSTIDPKHILKD